MEIIILDTEEELAHLAAEAIVRRVQRSPDLVLGLATGSTPLPLYRDLAQQHAAGVNFSSVRGFALDEYVGLPPEHAQSYARYIAENVTGPLGLRPELVHLPDGNADDLEEAAHRYERAIQAAGGVDVQILGIGANGHIGFNEPGSSLLSRTRIKTLTSKTRHDNARFFASPDDVPSHCLTQGLGTILDAHTAFLFAFGGHKAEAVARAVEGPVSASCPASVLQLHQHAVFFVDREAAAQLHRSDYYRETWAAKPAWQLL
ncbi:MAG: glucosamine-6-phosphate deaminase [Pseudoclavibacter sp.]|jgi:glucosamine-6-phosphate deaminase